MQDGVGLFCFRGVRRAGWLRRALLVAGGLLLSGSLQGATALGGAAQLGDSTLGAVQHGTGGGFGTQPPRGSGADTGRQDPGIAQMQEQQAKTRNDDRQKRLVDDTAKLYALAAELKEEVAKSDKNKLSIEVIKKADEIEHLAHNVKDRMKG